MTTLFGRPSAFMPLAMSAAALLTIAIHVALFGTAQQEDEGTAAHIWQLLMAGQLPLIAVFALRWIPTAPRAGLLVLASQVTAAAAAILPVVWFEW